METVLVIKEKMIIAFVLFLCCLTVQLKAQDKNSNITDERKIIQNSTLVLDIEEKCSFKNGFWADTSVPSLNAGLRMEKIKKTSFTGLPSEYSLYIEGNPGGGADAAGRVGYFVLLVLKNSKVKVLGSFACPAINPIISSDKAIIYLLESGSFSDRKFKKCTLKWKNNKLKIVSTSKDD